MNLLRALGMCRCVSLGLCVFWQMEQSSGQKGTYGDVE